MKIEPKVCCDDAGPAGVQWQGCMMVPLGHHAPTVQLYILYTPHKNLINQCNCCSFLSPIHHLFQPHPFLVFEGRDSYSKSFF